MDKSAALPKLLEEHLGLIEEIEGQLSVYRTDSLLSLDFFKSLTKISAKKVIGMELEGVNLSVSGAFFNSILKSSTPVCILGGR